MSLLLKSLLILTISTTLFSLSTPRALPPAGSHLFNGLTSMTDSKTGLADCWSALTELRSCTNEIVLFFLNGESYLTIGCCKAIRIITRDCWPTMLDSIGFTSQEADILRGYCDAETAPPPSALSPSGSVAGFGYDMGEVVG